MAGEQQSVKLIFDEAAEIASPEDRAAYLERACGGDADLRHKVDALLRALGEAGSFLESSPALDAWNVTDTAPESVPRDDPDDDPERTAARVVGSVDVEASVATGSLPLPQSLVEGPGAMIGPYKLLQKIGEGGMGVVFMAEQEKPVRRKVALKVIKPGMDTGQVIARFEAERQALAIMDHPHIARVLDAGATDTGRPYFVMELVKGVPITEYCDRNQLTPKERLELFIPVCQAIQHAHQKGIIHRDIKPPNVLVTLHDGRPLPKVIDFGVAKAIDQRLTERTMFTEFGAVIGTLEYMSPEQAEMGALDIDTRSDIYSLGVLLYELLTGSTPLERAKLRLAAYAEILRRIREEEATKPSTRLSESKDALPSISAQRKMEPARLTKLVRGDLDWIVMKSLEKDRTRRYESANGFARDIQRYLDGDPVEACPPSATYKLRKFARKHRVALSTAGAFALLLVAATAVSIGLALWANRERGRAVAAESSARTQKDRAEDREELAIDAVKHYADVIRETPELLKIPELAGLRAALLEEPQAFFRRLRERLQADKDTTPASLSRVASASFELGRLTSDVGDKQEALRAYEESLMIRERLASENPTIVEFQHLLAATHHDFGMLQSDTGRMAEALRSLDRARDIRERLAREAPAVARFRSSLASTYNDIGLVQFNKGRTAEALRSLEQGRDIRERLTSDGATSDGTWRDLANSHSNVGLLQSATGRLEEGLKSYQQAQRIMERLAREHPVVTQYWSELAAYWNNIGAGQSAMGRPAEAVKSFEQCREIMDRLAREHPAVTEFRRDQARYCSNVGVMQAQTGLLAEAVKSFEQARDIQQVLARQNPTVVDFQSNLAIYCCNIGNLHRNMGRPAESLAPFDQAREIFDRLAREHPESPEFANDLGTILNNMANNDLDQRRFDEARVKLIRAIECVRKALAVIPGNITYRRTLAEQLKGLIRADRALGRADEVAGAERELAELLDSDPIILALDARLAAVLAGKAMPKDEVERIQLADRAYKKALHSSSARLYAEALAKVLPTADDRRTRHAYNAACAAALAGSGQGKDVPPPDEAARAKLRRQALDWLKAELAAWASDLDKSPAASKVRIASTLQHWKNDADLAGIRDEKELANLPEEERAALKALWNDVDQLLRRATAGK